MAAIAGAENLWHFESGVWKDWATGSEYAVMAAMPMAVAELPDDVDTLKAMVRRYMAEQKALLEGAHQSSPSGEQDG